MPEQESKVFMFEDVLDKPMKNLETFDQLAGFNSELMNAVSVFLYGIKTSRGKSKTLTVLVAWNSMKEEQRTALLKNFTKFQIVTIGLAFLGVSNAGAGLFESLFSGMVGIQHCSDCSTCPMTDCPDRHGHNGKEKKNEDKG